MLKLSLYGFEFYLVKEQYVVFYLDCKLPHNSVYSESEAVRIVCNWIRNDDWFGMLTHYDGPTAQQFKEAYDRLEQVSKP